MRNRGFTMVELMIVISIIAVLASIIMPKMSGARDKAKLNACVYNIRSIVHALEIYANNNNGLYTPATGYAGISNTSFYLISGGYLRDVPLCPVVNVVNSYGIYCPAQNNLVKVYCRAGYIGTNHAGLSTEIPRYETGYGMRTR